MIEDIRRFEGFFVDFSYIGLHKETDFITQVQRGCNESLVLYQTATRQLLITCIFFQHNEIISIQRSFQPFAIPFIHRMEQALLGWALECQ